MLDGITVEMAEDPILLGIDTCGAVGSIALGKLDGKRVHLLGERSLPGGELSVSLLQALADLLLAAGMRVSDLAGIVAVAGPGSFTGIRIGLAAVKGLSEASGLPVVAVSRLALLANVAKTACAVLDAHRGQIFCGIYDEGQPGREMLLTAGEVNAIGGLPQPVGVCEDSVAHLLETLLGEPALQRISLTALNVLEFGAERWLAGEFADVALLDGYYLRGANARTQTELAGAGG